MNIAIETLARFYNALNNELGCNDYDKQLLVEAISSIDEVELAFNDDGNCSLPNIVLTKEAIKQMLTTYNPILDDIPMKKGDMPHRARITTELPKCHWAKLPTENKGEHQL